MATMNISIPDEMKAFVEEQTAKKGFGTVSEYMRDLIRGVQLRQAERQRVDALLLAGLESGPATPLTPEDWESIRQEIQRRHGRTPGTERWLGRLQGWYGVSRQYSTSLILQTSFVRVLHGAARYREASRIRRGNL